ncbi:FMN-dependent alpha-hydroxy acid dehydrogenase, partial [Aureobasidium melanogenum]
MPPKSSAPRYEQEVYMNGLAWHKPPFTFQSDQWEEEARKVLSANSFGYVRGNAGTSETYNKNLAAFQRWSILPSRLVPSFRDDEGRELMADTTTKLLGQELPFPMAAAPVGVQKIFHAEGEIASARATGGVGIPYVMSTASSTSIEDVAAAHDQGAKRNDKIPVRWFQLYWPSREHDDITISMLNRAKKAGFTALFVTLDTYTQGWRPADQDNGYNPFIHPDGAGGIGDAAREWTYTIVPGHSKSWEDLEFLKKHWDGPIVLKGIQTVADARKAVEAGMAGIVVSNHGGRQHNGGVSSLGVLPRIVDAVGDKLDVLFDSGIRSGVDIIKAIALGAKCVLVGRPYIYGLAIGGEDGVKHILRSLWGDALLNLHLGGQRDLSEVNRDMLIKEDDLFR